ncbi:MAG: pilus assembly protein TadG-related protein [Chloroflexota bacterium]
MSRMNQTGRQSGQVLVLFAISLTVIISVAGLAVDGGNGLTQRRNAQNTADFAALAGARIVAEWISGDLANGTDTNVRAAIQRTVDANGGDALSFGAPNGPRYIAEDGAEIGYIGSGSIPADAVGVRVTADRAFPTFFLRVAGINTWTAGATATARGGYATGAPSGGLFPAGIALAFFQTYPFCVGEVGSSESCDPQHLTPGSLNVPGGFGWLKFGCNGYGLGQDPPANSGGCSENKPFLQNEIGPPSNSYGCCTKVGLSGSADLIGSLPGNKVSADCSYWIEQKSTLVVPVWDYAGGTGSNGWYHIVGFAGFQITGCSGGKDLEGVWRKAFFEGPVTSQSNGLPFQSLGVQLIR